MKEDNAYKDWLNYRTDLNPSPNLEKRILAEIKKSSAPMEFGRILKFLNSPIILSNWMARVAFTIGIGSIGLARFSIITFNFIVP